MIFIEDNNFIEIDNVENLGLKIDIGCGRKKQEGFIGIDSSPYSTADYILDLNLDKLPFEDNSVDYVYSSHCLEHLDNLEHIVSEIYRVCKHNAQVFITVPYYNTSANLANIYHNNNIAFNEHTFRFFSSEEDCDIPKDDWVTPSCQTWGLKYSANSDMNIELRTQKIEFLYFPEYNNMTEEKKRMSRKKYNNVVEIINYYMIVIKNTENKIKKESLIIEPQSETIRKQHDYIQAQRKILDERYEMILKLQQEMILKDEYIHKQSILLDERYNLIIKLQENKE
ncbi:SAM-dependent methyltransferase [Acetoanaerobium pronyense]|uniref:SAM-dependent methyltransferase n=1 Tax=Acetoanaerobium pronyense TaxID=1482736 RepID=A0ABS4KHA4_9FIRM|nr:class I SAM-dependent methyltransferase [Acetoanaerobium pronyense]MBP2027142.1 SAM-dependent methyltransferase [Acetoanaerobium pronyense]